MHVYAVVVDCLNESAEMFCQEYGLYHLYKKMIRAECFSNGNGGAIVGK
jgi:hypothetical protein